MYTGSEDNIKAFNPDGTEKWTFAEQREHLSRRRLRWWGYFVRNPSTLYAINPDGSPRFSADGKMVYITAQILGGNPGDEYGYGYAIDTGSGSTGCTSACLRSTAINLSARLRNSEVFCIIVSDLNPINIPRVSLKPLSNRFCIHFASNLC